MKLTVFFIPGMLICLMSCTGQNASRSNPGGESANHTILGDTTDELGSNIMVVFQDSKNVYWFGSWETGLYRYDGKALLHYTTKHGLPHNRIDQIQEDRFGNLYFASGHSAAAILKYDGHQFLPLTARPSSDWQLLPDDLWFKVSGTPGHIYRFDGKTLHDLTFPNHPKFNQPFEIYSIYKDQKGNIWYGTNPLGVCRYNGKAFDWIIENDVTELHDGPANGVRSIIEDKDGYLWFNSAYRYKAFDDTAANRETFYERRTSIGNLDGNTGSNMNEYLSIAKDHDNNLWIATYQKGVWRYDGNSVRNYPVQESRKDINLFYIYTDNHGSIWLGTHQNGAWKLTGDNFTRFNP